MFQTKQLAPLGNSFASQKNHVMVVVQFCTELSLAILMLGTLISGIPKTCHLACETAHLFNSASKSKVDINIELQVQAASNFMNV